MILALILIFLLGYCLIIFEEVIKHDKSSIALILGSLLWMIYAFFSPDIVLVKEQLSHHIVEISSIIFFLMGAMTIVELIDINLGFNVILEKINFTHKKWLLMTLALLSFFLSAFLDNLTTAIIMASMSRKIFSDQNEKKLAAGMIIIAANAGGAWSPLGDVTTTMLWISNRISALHIIKELFIPSFTCVLVSCFIISIKFKGYIETIQVAIIPHKNLERNIIFVIGIALLLLVPIIKILTDLPPYMGMIFSVGLFWFLTEIIHKRKDRALRNENSIYIALDRIDLPSLLFFLGILLSVAALESSHILEQLAIIISQTISNTHIFSIIIGLVSSIFDNVPILAAIQGMYSTAYYPLDHPFWIFLAYCVGTGGSMLVIGSAAGVAIMNTENIGFVWYLKHITLAALIGFFSGAILYLLF